MTEIGTVLDGKYEILKKIGQGGMSVVYLAIDNRLKKQWAVKELRSNVEEVESVLHSIENEANILKRIDHPAIPRIVDILKENGVIYVVMDYVEGRTLAEIVEVEGAQEQNTVIEWGIQLADALKYLHSMNPPIIYRDMKPSNVMLKPDGSVKLIDFGTAKEFKAEKTADTTALGTRGYAAPEQFGDSTGKGKYNTDEKTDIYSLGATLYHMVTGKNPSDPPYEILPIREWNPNLSQGLEVIIKKCTEPNPENRYKNCAELIYAFEHYDTLDKSYRKREIKKMCLFLFSVCVTVFFFLLAGYGKRGKEELQMQEYKTVINQAQSLVMKNQYEDAVENLKVAIEKIDSTKAEAYEALMNIYILQGNLELGLNDICWYIDHYDSKKQPPSEVIYDVAKLYFNEQEYKKCYQYVTMIDDIEEAKYYEALSQIMSALYVDANEYNSELENFELYNETLQDSQNKLDNYQALVMTYTIKYSDNEEYLDKVIHLSESALAMLEKEEYEETYRNKENYIVTFCEYICRAYESRTELSNDDMQNQSNYNNIILYCRQAMEYLDENKEEDRKTKAALMLKICRSYSGMQKYDKAEECYEEMEHIFSASPDELESIYVSHMKLLCEMEKQKNSDIAKWNLTKIKELYHNAVKAVPEIENNSNWKKVLSNIEVGD